MGRKPEDGRGRAGASGQDWQQVMARVTRGYYRNDNITPIADNGCLRQPQYLVQTAQVCVAVP